MTTPFERKQSLIQAYEFMQELSMHIPAHRDRSFRLNVTACSGLS